MESTRDRETMRRRLDALRLPVVPLERHGSVRPLHAEAGEREAVGVGPDGSALAVWRVHAGGDRRHVTWHLAGRRQSVNAVDVDTDLDVTFVQPLPDGHVLLVAGRGGRAEVWSGDGDLLHRGDVGDAVHEVLTTASGLVWVGYFDEAMGGTGPEGHGLARFASDLSVDWLYPRDRGVPHIFDCYALNVAGETAYFCPYTEFPIVSVTGDRVTDWGLSPHQYGHQLLRRGPDLAVIGGPGPDYDVATILRIDRAHGIRQRGRCRLVLPDGLELSHIRYAGRGADLHAFDEAGTWYRTDLDALLSTVSTTTAP